ncbi:MAG: hypothetical protein LBS94_04745 [Prevotellaceae bacterium]|nr:hypothetical protein [Prevotellaceae bacterium]
MKKIIIISTSVVVVALLALALARYLRPMLAGDAELAVGDAEKICSITLSQGNAHLQLSRSRERWRIDGLREANLRRVEDALYAVQQLRIAYPLPARLRAAYDSAMHSSHAMSIELSDRWGVLRRYAMCSLDSLTVVEARKGNPYVVEASSYRSGSLASLFSINPLFWYSTTTIALAPGLLRRVTVEHFEHPQRSFSLAIDTAGHGLLTVLHCGTKTAQLNADRMYRYLSYYRELVHERYATELDSSQTAAIIASQPTYRLTIETAADSAFCVSIYSRAAASATDNFGRPATVDLNRCYLQRNSEPQLAIARWVDVDLLLVDAAWFF